MKKQYVIAGMVLVGIGVLIIYASRYGSRGPVGTPSSLPINSEAKPHSFEECAAQGYPILESQPRRCQAGKIAFIDNATLPPENAGNAPVVVEALSPHTRIMNSTIVQGKALGTWFFEASFPVRILDAQGNVVAETQAHADGDWQTTDYVPFTVTLTFTAPQTDTGFVEFAKDNPSGLPDLDASVRVPIRFK